MRFILGKSLRSQTWRRARATLAEERAAREEAEGAAERLRSELDGLRAAQARHCSCDGIICGPVHQALAYMLVSTFSWLSLKADSVTDRAYVA